MKKRLLTGFGVCLLSITAAGKLAGYHGAYIGHGPTMPPGPDEPMRVTHGPTMPPGPDEPIR